MYSIARIIVETYRIDSVRYIFGLPVAIVVSAGIIVLSAILFYINNKKVTE
jgi:prolipoprotein diacylglyceryltransferase